MSSNQVPLWVPIVVALVGFAGVLAAQMIASRREDKRKESELQREDKRWDREVQREDQRWAREQESRAEARSDKRRQELADAIAEYASSTTLLRRAEFDRGKKRINQAPEKEHKLAQQETYRLRAETNSKLYKVSLLSDQQTDRDLVNDAKAVIELCRRISAGPSTEAELHERNRTATEALEKLIEYASRRVQSQ
jgi:hypothetical protein